MSRRMRVYLPGVVFHITARALGKAPYFSAEPMRDTMLCRLARALRNCDALLIAYAILSNHYHLVVRQGLASLAQLMQPLNREIALMVQRDQNRKGYVFEKRFFAKPCTDADQMREMIVYTHRNAVRAGLCTDAKSWLWSSHRLYVGGPPANECDAHVQVALDLFADDESGTDAAAGYRRYMRWRTVCDCLPEGAIRPPKPRARFGDRFYARHFVAAPPVDLSPDADLRDVMLRTIREIAPGMTLDDLRSGARTRPFVEIRQQVIAKAIAARHRVSHIARFLNVSDSTVSRVAVTVRPRPLIRFDN